MLMLALAPWLVIVLGLLTLGHAFMFCPSVSPGFVNRDWSAPVDRGCLLRRRYTPAKLGGGKRTASTNTVIVAGHSTEHAKAPPHPLVDMGTAITLGAFAFESYRNPPSGSKWDLGKDGTSIAFSSEKFVTEAFAGLVTVTLLRAKGLPEESCVREKLLTGSRPDPYVTLRLEDRSLLSNVQSSSTKPNTRMPIWGELFLLYVKEIESATLDLKLMDKDTFSADDLIATASINLAELLQDTEGGEMQATWSGWIEMDPVVQEGASIAAGDGDAGAIEPAEQDPPKPVSLQLDIRYVPFDTYMSDQGVIEEEEEEVELFELKGPSGHDMDWTLCTKLLDEDHLDGRLFEFICFIENTKSDTQCGVWRDRPNKRLVLSFRGTEAVNWRDLITDLNALQEPLDAEVVPLEEQYERALAQAQKAFESISQGEVPEQLQGAESVLNGIWSTLDAVKSKVEVMQALPKEVSGVKNLSELGKNLDFMKQKVESVKEAAALDGVQPEAKMERVKEAAAMDAVLDTDAPLEGQVVSEDTGADADSGSSGSGASDLSKSGSGKELWDKLEAMKAQVESLQQATNATSQAAQEAQVQEMWDGLWSTIDAVKMQASASSASLQEAAAGAKEEASSSAASAASALATSSANSAVEGAKGLAKSWRGALMNMVGAIDNVEKTAMAAATDSQLLKEWYEEARLAIARGDKGPMAIPPLPELNSIKSEDVNKLIEELGVQTALEQTTTSIKGVTTMWETAMQEVQKVQDSANPREDLIKKMNSARDIDTTPRVHAGFRGAYKSVDQTLTDVVESATGGDADGWDIYITGHSLGGALATLCALDFSTKFSGAKITMYNYGSPRVGNRAFKQLFDSSVPDAFRAVNNLDVIARLPRARQAIGDWLEYEHVGRTLLLTPEDGGERAGIWVEGESEGVCPLAEMDALTALLMGDKSFVEGEWKSLQALLRGESLVHHTENSYFEVMESAARRWLVEKDTDLA